MLNNNMENNIKNNFDITNNKLKINHADKNNLCIICWFQDGKITLCVNCKLLYCDECAKKINYNCCICYRSKNTKQIYFDDEEFSFSYYPLFYTAFFFGLIFNAIIFIIVSVGFFFIFTMLLTWILSLLEKL
jgi:hypothetical protein